MLKYTFFKESNSKNRTSALSENYKMSQNAAVGQTLPGFGIKSMLGYFNVVKRVQKLIEVEEDIPLRRQIELLLLANKILIFSCIKEKYFTLKQKIESKDCLVTFLEQKLFNEIKKNRFEIRQMKAECMKPINKQLVEGQDREFEFAQALRRTEVFRLNQMLKQQFLLRSLIGKLIQVIKLTEKPWTSEQIAVKESVLMTLDFLISFLQLNAVLISNQCWIQFGRSTNIIKAVDSPLSINQVVLKNILHKVKILKLDSKPKAKV